MEAARRRELKAAKPSESSPPLKFKGSTDAELEAAERRGAEEMRRDGARLVHYAPDRDELLIELDSGNKVIIQRAQIPGLERATPEQLVDVVLSPMTTSISLQQRTAGAVTSAAKKAASAENGKRGGRPRKKRKEAAAT